jgi:hypothetical protein
MGMPPEEEPMPARRLAVSLGAVALTGAALIGSGTAVAGAAVAGGTASAGAAATPQVHKGIVPPKNPKRSLAPSPNFLGRPSCARGGDGRRCNTIVLRAITHARKVLEKMGAMHFSLAAYEKLTRNEQLFVTVNLERAARGMRPVTELTRSLNRVAQIGANADADPPLNQVPRTLPGGGHPVGLGGNWAGGWDNALGADYGWMYFDGPGADNGDCTKTNHSGCWGHRDNILGRFVTASACGGGRNETVMGAGHVTRGKAFGDSETELLVGVCGKAPTDVVMTWHRAKRLLHVKA